MAGIDDQRSWSLPDGFQRGESDPTGFDKINKKSRDTFAQSGVAFDGFTEAAHRQDAERAMEAAAEQALKNMDPDLKKMLKLDEPEELM